MMNSFYQVFNYQYLKLLQVFAFKKKIFNQQFNSSLSVGEIYQYWLLPLSCQKVDFIVFPEKCKLLRDTLNTMQPVNGILSEQGKERELSMYWGPYLDRTWLAVLAHSLPTLLHVLGTCSQGQIMLYACNAKQNVSRGPTPSNLVQYKNQQNGAIFNTKSEAISIASLQQWTFISSHLNKLLMY